MANYKSMYNSYNNLIKLFGDKSGLIGKGLDLKEHNWSDEDISAAYNYICEKLHISKDIDDNDGFAALLDLSFNSKKALLNVLKNLLKQTKDVVMASRLKNLINIISNYLEEKEEKEGVNQDLTHSLTQPYLGEESNKRLNKYYNYRKFAYRKAHDKNYLPISAPTIDTSKYDKLSREELVELYHSSKFYNLEKEDVMSLVQATVNEYCIANGVEPCAVVFEDLALSASEIQFGEYDPNKGSITINKKILDKFEDAKASGDQFYAYKLMSTIIHETKHRIQFSMLDNNNISEKDKAVCASLMHQQDSLSHSQYLAELDEVDARNAALEYIREASFSVKDSASANALKLFYNYEKTDEQNNGKNEIASELKTQFGDVYSTNKLDCTLSSALNQNSKAKCFAMLNGKSVPTFAPEP